jgi:hypothetical protein
MTHCLMTDWLRESHDASGSAPLDPLKAQRANGTSPCGS